MAKLSKYEWHQDNYTYKYIADKIEDIDEPYLSTSTAFLEQFREGDVFYSWNYYVNPTFAGGGICIFRNNKPVLFEQLHIS